MDYLSLVGRKSTLFVDDMYKHDKALSDIVSSSRFLVIGGAGSIGQQVSREIFRRNPVLLHVVDINENNLVELVRDLRSTVGYITGDFQTFAIDCGNREFAALLSTEGPYDYVFNLSALKHVRSEKDPYTLMRMIEVNILNTLKVLDLATRTGSNKYFCVSTDKAANPVSMLGASKRIMEMFLADESITLPVSTSRFANVAFSDGSLLHGFNQRIIKRQPLSAPSDVRRYFVTQQESGELCLISGLLGNDGDIFFPKLTGELSLTTFQDIAIRYLKELGYEPWLCESELEARDRSEELINTKYWPCYFFKTDTSGEKDFEEFFTENEKVDLTRFESIGVVRNQPVVGREQLDSFVEKVEELYERPVWKKSDIVELFVEILPNFDHIETGKSLNQRM